MFNLILRWIKYRINPVYNLEDTVCNDLMNKLRSEASNYSKRSISNDEILNSRWAKNYETKKFIRKINKNR